MSGVSFLQTMPILEEVPHQNGTSTQGILHVLVYRARKGSVDIFLPPPLQHQALSWCLSTINITILNQSLRRHASSWILEVQCHRENPAEPGERPAHCTQPYPKT
jgi:hypothetical protein